jgi:predicted RNA-binding protein with PIN domain
MGSGAVRMTPREFHFELERVRLAIQERLPKQIKTGESIETQLSSEAKALLNAIRKGNSS